MSVRWLSDGYLRAHYDLDLCQSHLYGHDAVGASEPRRVRYLCVFTRHEAREFVFNLCRSEEMRLQDCFISNQRSTL